MLILLTRASDGHKLYLKFHNINLGNARDSMSFTHCPLIKLSSMIAKDVATGICLIVFIAEMERF